MGGKWVKLTKKEEEEFDHAMNLVLDNPKTKKPPEKKVKKEMESLLEW